MPGPKKAQRTKGNLKPSSSSQAVQLLAQAGHSPTGFIGFSSQPAYVPASEIFDDADSVLDDDFRLVLRKFSKKDTVTKIKALQEFSSLCSSKGDDCIKAVVPFWPRIYNKVAIDVDHKVRELSQRALQSLAEKVGKNLSPHLRSIMGTWMISMCDTYPTVASAATAAFGSVFPATKQTAAVRFCKTECAEFFISNITEQTPQTLSDPLTTSQEDMHGKYQRVVTSSLHAMRKMITMLMKDSNEDGSTLETHLNSLLGCNAFWKHAKASVAMIQGGILGLLACVCQHCPTVSGAFITKISPLVFSLIDSKDSVLISNSWEALLCLINAHEKCWEHVNWQKAVWPKLKSVLEGGCNGYTEVIAPCLLPLISKLPQNNLCLLFESFRLGIVGIFLMARVTEGNNQGLFPSLKMLTQDSVVNSPSSMSALVKAFVECIHYYIKNHEGQSGDGQGEMVVQTLIQDQILVVVEASLTDLKVALSKSSLYQLLTPMFTFLEDQHPEIEKGFWKELSIFTRHNLLSYMGGMSSQSVDSKAVVQPINSFINRLSSLVKGLVCEKSESGPSKKEKVRFSTQEYISDKEIIQQKINKKALTSSMEDFISDLLILSFYLAAEFEALEYFHLFKNISILHFPANAAKRLNDREDSLKLQVTQELPSRQKEKSSDDLEIDKQLHDLYLKDGSSEFMNFLYSSLLKFIMNDERQVSTSLNMEFTEDIIVSSFSLLQYVDEEDGIQFLTTATKALSSTSSLAIMCQFIEHLIWHVKTIPACAKVLDMAVIHTKISEIAAGATVKGGAATDEVLSLSVWRMLTSFVMHLEQGSVTSHSSLDAVVSCCITSLNQCKRKVELSLESFSALLSVTQVLFENRLVAGHSQCSDLMSSLLLTVLVSKEFCDSSIDKLETVLIAGFRLIASDLPSHNNVLLQICSTIRNWVCTKLKANEDLDRVSKTVRSLVSVVSGHNDDLNEGNTDSDDKQQPPLTLRENVLDSLLNTDSFYVDELTEIINELYVEGRVLYPSQTNGGDANQATMCLEMFSMLSLYNLRTVKTLHGLHNSQPDLDDDKRRVVQSLTVTEMNCLVQVTTLLFILNSTGTSHQLVPKEVTCIAEELQSEITDCVSHMTGRQIWSLVDIAMKSSESSSLIVASGLEKCLIDILQSGSDIQSKRSTNTGVQLLQTRFIHRCIADKEKADKIASVLLQKPEWVGKDLIQAYSSVCTLIMESENICLRRISEYIFSFTHLLANCNDVTYQDRMSFFKSIVDITKSLQDKDIHLLTGSDSKDITKTDLLQYNTCVSRAMAMSRVFQMDEYWEFTLCTLVEWIQFLLEVEITSHSILELQGLMASTYHLAHFAAHTFATVPVMKETESISESVSIKQKTKTEWEEFFSEGVFQPTLSRFVAIATESLKSSSPKSWTCVINKTASAVSLCPANLTINHELPARLTFTDSSGIPDSLKTLLNHLCPLLNSNLWKVQFAAYNLLCSVMEDVAKHETNSSDGNKSDSQEEEFMSTPEALSVTVEANAACLDSFLMTEDIEHDVDIEAGSQEHTLTLGYLLAWGLQLKLFKCASNELRAKYAQFFKTHHYVSHLCDHLFRLMPLQPPTSMLEYKLAFDGTDEMSPTLLGTLAISVYSQCLEVLPALVRTWWVDQNSKISKFVNKFTTDYISSNLVVQQLTSPDMMSASIEDMTIRSRPTAKEVLAVYEMAEVTVSMTIRLPDNYPLGKMEVSCDKRVVANQQQWDRWMLQLHIFLQHQNGSIVEGLKLWKRNIDKKFEGIDDCMICFSVIHGTTFQLPRLTCRTCRKKFHSSCLYKWFYTSQKSTCPLCRNLF